MEDVLAPVEKVYRVFVFPPAGPEGAEGRETVSAAPEEMVTVIDGEVVETIVGCREHRASALTAVYVPDALHVLAALAAPADNHCETLPSDQENRYSTECPALEMALPVV